MCEKELYSEVSKKYPLSNLVIKNWKIWILGKTTSVQRTIGVSFVSLTQVVTLLSTISASRESRPYK